MYKNKSVYIEAFAAKIKRASQEENGNNLSSLFAYKEKHVDQLVAQSTKVRPKKKLFGNSSYFMYMYIYLYLYTCAFIVS